MRLVHRDGEPWFDGHFPGAPILPAVALLDDVDRALRAEGLALAGVERARFRRVIVPDESLEIEIDGASAPSLRRFLVRVGETVASDGVVRVAPAAPPTAIESVEPVEAPSPDVEALIPHRGAMRLVERLLDHGATTRALVRIGPRHGSNGFAPVVLALEAMAQAGAAAGRAERGWLVSVADAVFEVPALPVGAPLVAHATPMPGAPPLVLFHGGLEASGRELARARLGVMHAATGS